MHFNRVHTMPVLHGLPGNADQVFDFFNAFSKSPIS